VYFVDHQISISAMLRQLNALVSSSRLVVNKFQFIPVQGELLLSAVIFVFIHLPIVYRIWESIVETMFKPKSGHKVDSGVWNFGHISCMMRRPTKVAGCVNLAHHNWRFW